MSSSIFVIVNVLSVTNDSLESIKQQNLKFGTQQRLFTFAKSPYLYLMHFILCIANACNFATVSECLIGDNE